MLNLDPWGKSHVSPLVLFCSPSLVSSNYHFNVLLISWGIYCWGVECGKTVSPFPHAHSTSGLTLMMEGKPLPHHSIWIFHYFLHDYMGRPPTLPSLLISRRVILLPHALLGFSIVVPHTEMR